MSTTTLLTGTAAETSKLSLSDAIEIRCYHRRGVTYADLARGYDVSTQTIYSIVKRQTWPVEHITEAVNSRRRYNTRGIREGGWQ